MMLTQLRTFALLAVCLFAMGMGDCGGKPPPLPDDEINFLSADPADGSTIQPDATMTFTFDGPISDDQVGVILGRDPNERGREVRRLKVTGNTATLTGPFEPGHLRVDLGWMTETVAVLNYTVEEPPPPPPKTPTFKEQLEGDWYITAGALSTDSIVPEITDSFTKAGWFVIPSIFFSNRLQFESSGKVVLTYRVGYVNALPPGGGAIDNVDFTYTLKGSYWIADDSGTSATMTLSFTDFEFESNPAGNWAFPKDVRNGGSLAAFLGDVLNAERAAINGDQLSVGQIIATRSN